MSKKCKKIKCRFWRLFFGKSRFVKNNLARFWWNPQLRYWFSSPGSNFQLPRRSGNFFEFSRTREFGTFSTQTQLLLKVSKTRLRLVFLKSPTGACQIPLKSILAAPPWKINIRDDSGVKFWLTLYLTNREISKKNSRKQPLKMFAFFSGFL